MSVLLRYVPKDYPHAQEFGVSGVRVALDKSDDKTVEIISIALDTAGTYMCEVEWSHIRDEDHSIFCSG